MGYFSNGAEGEAYEERYCNRCVHQDFNAARCCPCLEAHKLWNYDECNKPESLLHKMIPREKGSNGECIFFKERPGARKKAASDALLAKRVKRVLQMLEGYQRACESFGRALEAVGPGDAKEKEFRRRLAEYRSMPGRKRLTWRDLEPEIEGIERRLRSLGSPEGAEELHALGEAYYAKVEQFRTLPREDGALPDEGLEFENLLDFLKPLASGRIPCIDDFIGSSR